MEFKNVSDKEKTDFNQAVSHPLQSFEWGEFRKKTGIKVIRRLVLEGGNIVDAFQLTLHKIPKTNWNIGYLPKGNRPTMEVLEELKKIGRDEKCVFIQLEPNVLEEHIGLIKKFKVLVPSAHPLFTKYTLELDLTKTEEEILKNMHPKTRYNIRIAQKHNVKVKEDWSEKAFSRYLELSEETTRRQKFYAHSEEYHRLLWKTLGKESGKDKLSAHLFTASLGEKILTAWVLFVFHDSLYYPYGASSSEHREVMASNLIMWEAIRFGKKLGLKKFDMWGALSENPDPKDPWFGFHRFKMGYGPEHVEFVGSFDLIVNPSFYQIYKTLDKLRWAYLRLRK